MRKKHNQDMFFCIFHDCTSSFSDKESFDNHRKEVHATGVKCRIKNICQICGVKFKDNITFKNHRMSCSQRRVIQEKSSSVNTNKGKFRKNRESGTNCKVCNKAFKYPCNVTRHMQKMHNIKEFACSTPGCGAILESKDLAMQHRRDIHAKVKLVDINAASKSKQARVPTGICSMVPLMPIR